MSTTARRTLAGFLILLSALALVGCGSSRGPIVCAEMGCCGASDACPVIEHLVTTHASGQVSAFTVNPATGYLGTPVITTTGGPTAGLGVSVLSNTYIYASDFSNASIDGWFLNPGTGSLAPIPGSPFSLGPLSVGAGMAVNDLTQIVYVADAGKIDVFKADSSGALSAIAGSPVSSGTNLFLTIDTNGQFLFAADDDPPGGILAFTLDSTTGLPTAVAGSPFAAVPGSSVNTHPGQIAVDTSGSFVYTALNATNQVAAFSIVKPAGTLTALPGSPFPAGTGPVALIVAGNFLYVSNTDGTISGYKIDSTTGVLTALTGSPFAIRAGSFATNLFGSVLYATGAGGIQAFNIDSTTGALTAIAGSPFPDPGAALLAFMP